MYVSKDIYENDGTEMSQLNEHGFDVTKRMFNGHGAS